MVSAFQSTNAGASRRWIITFVAAPAAVAWALLWWFGSSSFGRYFEHRDLASSSGSAPLVLVGWLVMIAAMMLPTTAPLLAVFRRIVADRPNPGRLLGAVIAGYAAVWTLVGGAAIVGDMVLHRLVSVQQGDGVDRRIAIALLAVAGVYQFTPLKRRCLTSCRSPFLFVSRHWRGNDPRWDAFHLGVAHGWFCVGCCWTLMLTLFGLGMGNLVWMFLLGALMGIEKNVASARFLGPVLGVALLAGAVVLAVGG